MLKKTLISFFSFFFLILLSSDVTALKYKEASDAGYMVTKAQRRNVTETQFGKVSAIEIKDVPREPYHLQFITMEPNSLFLPVLLHTDMVFYVNTGNGSLSWVDDDGKQTMTVKRGDIYRLRPGTAFFIKSSLDFTEEKLRIYAIFLNVNNEYPNELPIGPYSRVNDIVLGFDEKILQAAFQAPEEVIEDITKGKKLPAIVPMPSSKNDTDNTDWRNEIIKALIGNPKLYHHNNKKKEKAKSFNIFNVDPDVKNCFGWSKTVTKDDLDALERSNVGVFMVNLTKGSMMGPHWNPRATEIAIVTSGEGMVHIVCPSLAHKYTCKNSRFRVEEGDVFVVPRFHPMAQMAFNNNSLVFMGFQTANTKNYPQFLAGKRSVLRTLDKEVVAITLNVSNVTVDKLLGSQSKEIILECTSCAEEEIEREEEERRRREEEAERRRQEEERKREEEEAEKRREEEEERRREEEAERRRQEEERKREEEEAERKRQEEEEERRREEEEEERRQEEERKREEEEAERKRQEEEEEERREEEEEERRRREEEERRKQEEKERKQEEEEEKERRREEESEKQWWEEEEDRRRQEEKEKKQWEEDEKEAARKWEYDERRRREEEAPGWREKERRKREEEAEWGWGMNEEKVNSVINHGVSK